MTITILSARKIITMSPSNPEATHVALRDGRILGAGSLEEMKMFGAHELDERFAEKVLMPGMVEGHSHSGEGAVWEHAYVGFQGRYDPEGIYWPGVESLDAVVERLKEAEAALDDPAEPLFAWGFDPIYFDNERMTIKHIDRVSQNRPIVVLHSNGHLMNVNSVVLDRASISNQTNVHGVLKDAKGDVTGELMEMAAHYMAWKVTGKPIFSTVTEQSLRRYAQSACNAGVTTATDLFASFDEENLSSFRTIAEDKRYPLRLLPAMNTLDLPFDEGVKVLRQVMKTSTDRLIFGLCKVMTDGSIQGYTARMRWPGYHDGAPNGLWNLEPEQLTALVRHYHKAGAHLHIHTNGDEASELMIDAIETAVGESSRADHRHTLQHCQMADEAQFRRMGNLGICANLFANHIYYWGDEHRRLTMGPDRARRMDACRTALRHGVPLAIHSDAPVTPLAPLFTAWCAVNRQTASGHVLGAEECLNVHEALHAITIGAAYTIRMDHLVGSIESGKHADFAVLNDDPTTIDPLALKDIAIQGTIVGGEWFPAAEKRTAEAN